MNIYVFVVVSLRSHVYAITIFNCLNFSERHEQVNFHLGVLDLDLALDDAFFNQNWAGVCGGRRVGQ